MMISGAIWFCDGCKVMVKSEDVPADTKHPPGWLLFDGYPDHRWETMSTADKGPWGGYVSACSADCVNAAKEHCKAKARAAVERWCKRIDDAKLVTP